MMLQKPNKDNKYLVTKYLLSFIGFSNIMYKLLVILFVIKLYARNIVFKLMKAL